ncbi:MAG: glutamate synthase large subunit [Burkholderiales bacterium]|nr:glutamate synthase large subunit [Burkholderiales bacterium]
MNTSLYRESFEFDSCGVGFVANIKGNKTHKIIDDALTILENMKHRGATGVEKDTGDGAGICCQIPHEFLFNQCAKLGFNLPLSGSYAVAMVFIPKNTKHKNQFLEIFNRSCLNYNLKLIGHRLVPVNNSSLGKGALKSEPDIYQMFITYSFKDFAHDVFERKLYLLRRNVTRLIRASLFESREFYIASLSTKKIVYKGQLTSEQLRDYFPDLIQQQFTSAFGLVHARFSTNTQPQWSLAQPFRYLAHNGEINTLQGNLNWLTSREKNFISEQFTKQELDSIIPVSNRKQSDSASLDNLVELLLLNGRSLPQAMMMLIPEAWENNILMEKNKRAFYEFHSYLIEPWDGPAAIIFTDGDIIGATLDRNGLRPARYWITHDDRVVLASESGVLPEIEANLIKHKGMLSPGQMFCVDLIKGKVISDSELKNEVCNAKPYAEWLSKYKIKLDSLPEAFLAFKKITQSNLLKYHKAFGYAKEDINFIIAAMACDGKEPVGSMGNDTPLAILSHKPQHLSNYFKQLFAQVTNPPIDSIRERSVMSLTTFVGKLGYLLVEKPEDCHVLSLDSPIIDEEMLNKITCLDTNVCQTKTIYTYFNADGKTNSLEKGIDRVCRYAKDAIEEGFSIIVLSDRGIDSKHAAIPSLLMVSSLHQYLINNAMRGKVGIIVAAGDAWEVHHFACLISFGANAVCPYLALATIESLHTNKQIASNLEFKQLKYNYIKSINDGLLKIFAKMGISTLYSYLGAQAFEAIGIHPTVIDKYFSGVVSRVGGIDLNGIAQEALAKHQTAFNNNANQPLVNAGIYQWRNYGEKHLFNPDTIAILQHAIYTNDYTLYKKYAKLINENSENACTLRGLLEFQRDRPQIALTEVEPVENILKRFATGAMSFGSISWEAHTTLAIAMNRIGAKSNTGEGGEDENRYIPLANGDSLRSSIKQIASGRFGVTSRYLVEAEELQIKLAQGAKPGEGGQLPGDKVDKWIAKTRHSLQGVGLISPPPHHDIYSIEDLAQLIFDLKNANNRAQISVKLVAKAGVGTIATGVAKAKADTILISGHDGGTGASALSSIRYAGIPWELGLAETHQTLVKNNLRDAVTLQTDGQIKTGRDIAIATLLGAEEWGVASAALIAEGCIMMRKCHLNTCPVGIATQNQELRKRFKGTAENVITLFNFLAEELREIMAYLGYKTINEMVGRANCLKVKSDIQFWKAKTIDFSQILYYDKENSAAMYKSTTTNSTNKDQLEQQILAATADAVENIKPLSLEFPIKNTNLATGTLLSSTITQKYRDKILPEDLIRLKFTGTAGQSFGAFSVKGVMLELEGDANDYFGKGLSGAKLIVYPPNNSSFKANENVIIGNVAFYGATSGEGYISGIAGGRFAVRNSGASLVVEGVGDHCCEYMTGGFVVVLGKVGINFAAGMSGGIAFVYDPESNFDNNCNQEMVDIEMLDTVDLNKLKVLLEKHYQATKSMIAKFILDDFLALSIKFKKIFPKEYKRALLQEQQELLQENINLTHHKSIIHV